jgi:hypothetical protein
MAVKTMLFWVVTPCGFIGFVSEKHTVSIFRKATVCFYLPASPHGVTTQNNITVAT